MISVEKLTKQFGKLTALDSVSMKLEKGKCYALVGPNGSGKTTLIKTILGMVVPTAGDIKIDGESILGKYEYRNKIGYMPQIGRYPDNMKIGQIISMIKDIRFPASDTDEELVNGFRLNEMSDKSMRTLSGGTRQKVSAAVAFMFKPDILILDEPTAGLDPVAVEILKEKIEKAKHEGKLIIISSHIMSDLDDLATDIIYLHDGTVKYSNPIEILKEETGHERLGKAISAIITRQTNRQQELKVN